MKNDYLQKAKENLCYYDKRNPDSIEIDELDRSLLLAQGPCACDNCFYGKTSLAEIIINLIEKK